MKKKVRLHLAKPTPEALAALFKKITGKEISVEKVRAALAKCSPRRGKS